MKIWINRAGQNLGTFTEEEVQRGLSQGQFVATDLAWQEGMDTWKPLSEFPSLQMPPERESAPSTTPPLPFAPPVSPTALAIAEGQEEGPAWEQRQTLGILKALVQTWKEVLLKPATTFSNMKSTGGFTSPLLFTGVMFVIWAAFALVYQLIGQWFLALKGSSGTDSSTMAAFGVGASAFSVIMILFSIPLMLAMSFVSAGITHFCLSLFKGTSKGYEATYRVIAYSYSAWILTVIPCVGGILAGVWGLVCTIVGLSRVHRTEGWRAAIGLLLPAFVCAAAGLLIALMLYSAGRSANN
jgi:hypothetical protein